ncbi:MAG: glycosyltransferase [bacterium]
MDNKPKYNILMLGWEFYPVFAGGMGVVTSEIVDGLTDANIGVHFVIPRLPKKIEIEKVHITSAEAFIPSESSLFTVNNYSSILKRTYVDTVYAPYETKNIFNQSEVTKYNERVKVNFENKVTNPNSIYHNDLFADIKMFEDKSALIALENNFDIIHAHDWLTFRAAIKAKELTGKPVVLHVHATEIDRSGENVNTVIFDIEKECLEKADYVIAVSAKTKNDIIKHYNIPENKVFVVHNSSNFHQPHTRSILSKEDKIVLFLGRITMQKGAEYFIQAAAKVLRFLPDTIFVMVGDGDKLQECIDLVNELNIEKNFIFTGFLTGHNKERMYSSADLFVMPSVSEPFGVVALEAIRSGTPVIVSKTSGAAEIINNSLKIDFWDVNKLADTMHATLKYQSLHDEMIENQGRDLNEQNWNHQIDAIIKVYELATKN